MYKELYYSFFHSFLTKEDKKQLSNITKEENEVQLEVSQNVRTKRETPVRYDVFLESEAIYRLIRLNQFIRDSEMALFLPVPNLVQSLVIIKNSSENARSYI